MKIEVGKIYLSASNERVRIICNDLKSDTAKCIVVGAVSPNSGVNEGVAFYTLSGESERGPAYDLVSEYSPWLEVAIDTPVWLKTGESYTTWHFAGTKTHHGELCLYIWNNGCTSHTTNTKMHVDAPRLFLKKP